MLSGVAFRVLDLSIGNRIAYAVLSKSLIAAEILKMIFRSGKKTDGKVGSLQGMLVPLIRKMRADGEIRFTSDWYRGAPGGEYWRLISRTGGEYLYDPFRRNPDIAIRLAHAVCIDYQKVVDRCRGSAVIDSDKACDWLWGSLAKWSVPIVRTGLMSREEIVGLAEEFKSAMARKGDGFFGWAHGNVIGNHVFIGSDQEIYLLGMRIVPRPGRGYYDFLRALDWFFLHSSGNDAAFRRTASWIGEYLGDFDKDEVKLVFALRCIGILGWDMLHLGAGTTADMKTKTRNLLRFIRQEW